MTSCALVKRLEAYVDLTSEEKAVLNAASSRTQAVDARQDIIREGDAPRDVHLVTSGLACRYKLLESGRRQIVAFLVPGDFCDMNVFILKQMDHTIATLSPVRVACLSPEQTNDLMRYPGISRAMWMATLVDESVLREWVTNIGQRSATSRLAHLFCEMLLRLTNVGATNALEYQLPITQTELAEALGISTVHVNRSLHVLRTSGLVDFKSKKVVIHDLAGLKKEAGFRDNYLHLQRGSQDQVKDEAVPLIDATHDYDRSFAGASG